MSNKGRFFRYIQAFLAKRRPGQQPYLKKPPKLRSGGWKEYGYFPVI